MQGTLDELDLHSLLQLIELGQWTGQLLIEAIAGQSWLIFFTYGKFVYSTELGGDLSRLQDYLRQYQESITLNPIQIQTLAPGDIPEYSYLWALLQRQLITPEQGSQILEAMLRETLFDLLSLRWGSFQFKFGPARWPQLRLLEVAPLLSQITTQLQEWKRFYPYLQSPEQSLEISQLPKLQERLPPSILNRLLLWAQSHASLRQLARFSGQDMLTIARMVYPYVKQGLIHLDCPLAKSSPVNSGTGRPLTASRNVPRIVCVDPDVAICQTVEGILSQSGYEVSTIAHPLKALSLVFQLKPDLILCDVAMPELNGYELCAMLRSSAVFRRVPIILLIRQEQWSDRTRAEMAGATDCLTQPFAAAELLMLIQHYVGSGDPNRPNPDKLLAEALKEELLLDSAVPLSMPSSFY